MILLLLFAGAMFAYGVFVLALTYRFRDRGDIWPAVGHGLVLITVGVLASVAAFAPSQRRVLIGALGVLLAADVLVRLALSRRTA